MAEGIPSQPHSKEFTRKISSARKELTVAEESPEIFTSQQESKIGKIFGIYSEMKM